MMRSYDGAMFCKLVDTLESSTLYMDNGLLLMRNGKEVIKMFKEIGFKIKIKTNLKVIDFIDTIFDLAAVRDKPYRKRNDKSLYINITSSSHPSHHQHQNQAVINVKIPKNSQKFIKYRNF